MHPFANFWQYIARSIMLGVHVTVLFGVKRKLNPIIRSFVLADSVHFPIFTVVARILIPLFFSCLLHSGRTSSAKTPNTPCHDMQSDRKVCYKVKVSSHFHVPTLCVPGLVRMTASELTLFDHFIGYSRFTSRVTLGSAFIFFIVQQVKCCLCQAEHNTIFNFEIDTDTAIDILEGCFEVLPPDTDGTTLLLLQEMANILQLMKDGKVDIVVTVDDFKHYWRRAKERTSSSHSKLHFGHYKLAAFSDYLSEVHALKLSLISKTGSAPQRWARGLSVMLEKIAGWQW